MIISPSTKLKNVVSTILENTESQFCTIECVFYSPENPDIKISPIMLEKFYINQVFHSTYTDEILLSAHFVTEQTLQLLENYQDLRCALTFYRVEEHTYTLINTIPPLRLNYYVIIENAADLLKQYSKHMLTPPTEEETLDVHQSRLLVLNFQLFEETAYHLRHKQFNALLKNVTMLDVLHYVANILEITDIDIVPPDNTRVYSSLALPPMLDITTVFDFLQDRYGIYSKGLVYYIVQNKLYIYPGYNTTPSTDKVVHIYNVPADMYLGSKGYHYIDEYENIHILGNHKVSSKDMSTQGEENFGNFKVALRTDMTIDHTREAVGEKGKYSNNNTIACGLTSNKSARDGARNPKYETSSNNVFKMASDIANQDCTIVGTAWSMAEPYILHPGQKIFYHYDGAEGYTTVTGVIEEIRYMYEEVHRSGYFIYICVAVYALRLNSEMT